MLADLQKRTAQGIVNIFETGQVQGDYGKVTLLAGDTGHLTYGRSQTTLASGNLYLLTRVHREADGAQPGRWPTFSRGWSSPGLPRSGGPFSAG